jgi:hypothetical protein
LLLPSSFLLYQTSSYFFKTHLSSSCLLRMTTTRIRRTMGSLISFHDETKPPPPLH